jgi:hypothetical protein
MRLTTFLSLVFFFTSVGLAQWSLSPGINTPVSTAAGDQTGSSIVSDDSGGAIVAWTDGRGTHSAIYAQRVDAAGFARWSSNGVPVCVQSASQEMVQLVADGSGGAFVSWRDYRNGDTMLYCQRISRAGVLQWDAAGVAITTSDSGRVYQAISDGRNGLIIAWEDTRNGNIDIYAERIGTSGNILWASGGMPVCTDPGDQTGPELTATGDGGLLCIWTDSRSPGVYLQKLNSSGIPIWPTNGIPVVAPGSGNPAALPTIASDGAAGAMVVYFSHYSAQPRLVVAQRVDSSGTTRWLDTLDQSSGPPQNYIRVLGFGSGPAFTTFTIRTSNGFYSFGTVSSVDTSGTILWKLLPFDYQSDILAAASDKAGGVFLLASIDHPYDYYRFSVQHIDAAGNSTWTGGGIDIDTTSAIPGSGLLPVNPVMIPDGAGGVIAAWEQNRTGTLDIFAQHVDVNGALPIQLSSFEAVAAAGSNVKVIWKTVSEVNCYGFEVQKAKNGPPDFQPVPTSFTKGGGTTISPRSYSFTDANVPPGEWDYRLKQIDLDGTVHYSEVFEVSVSNAPVVFALNQNYPNPFNPSTTISYDLPVNSTVSLNIISTLGQNVATLVNGVQPAGTYRVTYNAQGLASGVYFCRIQAGKFVAVKKILLVK